MAIPLKKLKTVPPGHHAASVNIQGSLQDSGRHLRRNAGAVFSALQQDDPLDYSCETAAITKV